MKFEDWWERVKNKPPYTPKEIAREAWNRSFSEARSIVRDEAQRMPHDTLATIDGNLASRQS